MDNKNFENNIFQTYNGQTKTIQQQNQTFPNYSQEGSTFPAIWDPFHPYYKPTAFSQKQPNNSTKNLVEASQECPPRSNSHELKPQQYDYQDEFDLNTFKTRLCSIQESHNKKHCLFYHNENDKRRNPSQLSYKCDLCQNGRNCSSEDKCNFSHNKVEQLYHPNRYKTKYCQTNGRCEYGKYCSFAHSDQEIVIPFKLHKMLLNQDFWMYLYKTVWCPFTENHDRGSCVYAHNAQDFRRDPKFFKYEPIDCQHWKKSPNVQTYEQGGCPQNQNCQYSHGWKEQEYHPKYYKTKYCSNGNGCPKKDRECAYYHRDENDKHTDKRSFKPIQKTDYTFTAQNDNYETLVGQKKMPIKAKSNFNGPIIPKNQMIHQDQDDSKLSQSKLEKGQPFEVFSQSQTTGIEGQDSRKSSDIPSEHKKNDKSEIGDQILKKEIIYSTKLMKQLQKKKVIQIQIKIYRNRVKILLNYQWKHKLGRKNY